jgi:hypothetical protein
MSNTDNTDFFAIFSSDNGTSEPLPTTVDLVDLGDLEGYGADQLDNFEDLFETFALVDAGEELSHFIPTLQSPHSPQSSQSPQSSPPPQSPQSSPFPLIPPFLVEYQGLSQKTNELQEALRQAQKQLESQERRSLSCDDLIQQQAEEISKSREQLTHTVAEIQVYQQEAQKQQLQIETLAEQLAQSQNLLAERERDCVRLQENYQTSHQQVLLMDKQMQELRARLQRQQRYAMQYKAALEQCLATPNLNPSSDITTAIASFTGKAAGIQPWSKSGTEEAMIPLKSVLENVLGDEHLTAKAPDKTPEVAEISIPVSTPETIQPAIAPASITSETVKPEISVPSLPEMNSPAPLPDVAPSLPISSSPNSQSDSLSFAIQPQRVIRKSIDLPRFRRLPIQNA